MKSEKRYRGQCQKGYGYGGIIDCEAYLEDRYGCHAELATAPASVKYNDGTKMTGLRMSRLEKKDGKSVNNCVLTAISSILLFYHHCGYNRIDGNLVTLYEKVRKIGIKHGYTQQKGLGFHKIDNVATEILHDYGYENGKCKGHYVWTFNQQVKKEIDANRSVIMSIARGYYRNHTITVCGYRTYTSGTRLHNLLEVYDGWSEQSRYIDYEAFSLNLLTAGIGSFNTITIE